MGLDFRGYELHNPQRIDLDILYACDSIKNTHSEEFGALIRPPLHIKELHWKGDNWVNTALLANGRAHQEYRNLCGYQAWEYKGKELKNDFDRWQAVCDCVKKSRQ